MTQLERFAERYELSPSLLRRWLVEAMVLGAAADGAIDKREGDEIALLVSTYADFADIERGELQASLRGAVEGIRRDGFIPRVHAMSGALTRYAHRVLAFRVATRVAMADGRISADELGLLREMQAVFGITESDVARAIEDAQAGGASVPSEMEPIEAYLDCLMMAASCDGALADEELALIIAFMMGRPELEALDGDMLRDYISVNAQRFADESERLDRLALIGDDLPLPEHRENAWALAVEMVAADGMYRAEEQRFLERLEEALTMDETRAALAGDLDLEG